MVEGGLNLTKKSLGKKIFPISQMTFLPPTHN